MSSDLETDGDVSKMQSEKQYLAWGFPKDIAISEKTKLKAEAKNTKHKDITNKILGIPSPSKFPEKRCI